MPGLGRNRSAALGSPCLSQPLLSQYCVKTRTSPAYPEVPAAGERSGMLRSAAFSHGCQEDLLGPRKSGGDGPFHSVAPPLSGQQHSLWLSFDSQSRLGGEAAGARWTQWHLSHRLSQDLMRYCVDSASDPCLAHREGSTGHSVPFPCGLMLCLYGGRSLSQKVLELTWRRLILSLLPAESSSTAGQLSSTVTLREQQRHLLLWVHSASAL